LQVLNYKLFLWSYVIASRDSGAAIQKETTPSLRAKRSNPLYKILTALYTLGCRVGPLFRLRHKFIDKNSQHNTPQQKTRQVIMTCRV
jgi:hypothetical protein